MELISVIVPVYNVEKYIHRCIDSILSQSYTNLEIILVDDGSTDSSGKVCDDYLKVDSRIRVIHQENQGLGTARNSGLKIASGKYVSFIDSDDWIATNMYDVLYKSLKKSNSDIALCGRMIATDDTILKKVFCLDKQQVLSGSDIISHYLLQQDMNMAAWDKLFKIELLDKIKFPSGYVSEDIVPIYKILKRTERIILTGEPLYYYYVRPGSLSKSKFTPKRMGPYIYIQEIVNDVRKSFPELKNQADCYFYDCLLTTWHSIRKSNYLGEEKVVIYNEIKKNKKSIIKNNFVNLKMKLYTISILLGFDKFVDNVYRKIKNS